MSTRDPTKTLLEDPSRALSAFLESMLRETDAMEPALVARLDAGAVGALPGGRLGGRPEWAVGPFEALLLDVGVVKLALPLVSLAGVVPWPATMTQLPGQWASVLGVFTHLGRHVRVVDTQALVRPGGGELVRDPPRQVVLVACGDWGLAGLAVSDVFRQDPEAVRWRPAGEARPWLVGTLKDRMSGLVDPCRLVESIEQSGPGMPNA